MLYITNGDDTKAFGTVLGILEALGVLNFKLTGARYRNKIPEFVTEAVAH